MADKSVVITGGRGFVGRHIAAKLLDLGRDVVTLDVGSPTAGESGRLGLRHVVGDVRNRELVEDLVAGASLVLHLAAVVGVDEYLSRPEEVLDVGILGSRAVFDACARLGRPVVFASTSEIYGKNVAELREDSDSHLGSADRARWSYAISKLASEQWAHALARRGLRHLTVRYFNVYGPGLDAGGRGRVLAKMIRAVRAGEPITLVDGGEAVRSFCHVDDAVEGTLRLALSLEREDRLVGRTFNVGRCEPVTMRALAERVVRLTGHRAGTVDVPGPKAFGEGFEEIPSRVPDVEALHEAVGFRAEIDLDEGLRRTLAEERLLRAETTEAAATPTFAAVPWVRPIFEPDASLLARVRTSLATGNVTNGGPLVRRFEAEVGRWLGRDEVIAVTNGTVALSLAALALELRGSVVLPSFTYAATLNAFELAGLEPIFCDVDPTTWTLDPAALSRVLGARSGVAAVVAVNAFGVPPELAEISRVARAHGAALVYDAAHGIGTMRGGLRVPPEPDVTTFSLHATKNLPAVEGGLVVARDQRVAAEIRRLRTHGLSADPLDSTPGPNAKLDELRAAVALHGLARLDASLERRARYAERLRAAAKAPGVLLQRIPEDVTSSHQNLSVVLDGDPPPDVPRVMSLLRELGVETRRYFHPALHELRRFGARDSLPVTERLAARVLAFPLHSRMGDAELATVERGLARAGRLA